MSIYERESFADFIAHILRIRSEAGLNHDVHEALMEGRSNDEETVASIASSPTEAVAVRKALRTLHSDFPYGAGLPDVCAYFVRGYIGLNPFGDNDAETAWTYLHDLLDRTGLNVTTGDAAAATTDTLAAIQAHYPLGFHRGNVLDRGPDFDALSAWFAAHGASPDQHL